MEKDGVKVGGFGAEELNSHPERSELTPDPSLEKRGEI